MSVFYDAWQCPIVTFLIILSIARYTKLWKGLGNTIEYIVNNNSSNSSSSSPSRSRDDVDTYTLDELENKGEYWRILNSTFNIQNPFHLWLAVVSFWGCKEIEIRIGSINFILYAIIFMLSNAFISINSVYLLRKQTLFPSRIFNISSHTKLPTSGLLDLTFAFLIADALTFSKQHFGSASSSSPDTIIPTYFVVGLIETPTIVAPTFLLLICQLMLDKIQWLANLASIITGFMLWLGPLQIIPNWYWKICLLSNVIMLSMSNHVLKNNHNNNDDDNNNQDTNINTNSNGTISNHETATTTMQHEHSFSLNGSSNYEAVSVSNFQTDTTITSSNSGSSSSLSSYNQINGLLDRDEYV